MELQLQHLCKHYGTKCAVNHVSTTLTPGVYDLLGANGAGKTTLMRMICEVLKPTSGRLCLDRKSIEKLGKHITPAWGICRKTSAFIQISPPVSLCDTWRRSRGLISGKQRTELRNCWNSSICVMWRTGKSSSFPAA